jgi:transcriptional regulator
MYTDKNTQETDPEKIIGFIRQHNFGALVSAIDGNLQATHLPFELTGDNSAAVSLKTHMARANKQWKTLSADTEVMVIFQGPNSYISPRWYDHINVPTMNYIAVHVYGKPKIIQDPEEIYHMLKHQIEAYEKEHIAEYNIETLPSQYLQNQMRALVALEISISRIEANFKLSQNRDEANYKNIIEQLRKREDPNAVAIADEMMKVYRNKGYKYTDK